MPFQFFSKFDAKPDSELFVVDTGGDEVPVDAEAKPLSAKLKKRQKLAEGPKCFEILIPDSKVNYSKHLKLSSISLPFCC